MKQLVQFKRIFAAVLLLTVSTLSWANGTNINGIYYVLDSSKKTAMVTHTGTTTMDYNPSSTAYTGSITIPSTVTYKSTTYSVTKIIGDAFSGCSGLTSITIPNSVTEIGAYAFSGCSGLTSVTIPRSVTSIGNSPFYRCSSLTSIVVDKDNTYYDSRDNCNAIIHTSSNTLISGCKNTVIPNSVTSIGYSAFYGCSGLTSITIPESVTSIGQSAFSGCSGLTSVTIGNSVTSIGSYAFYGCSGLTSVTIPNSVTSIDQYAFRNCTGLTSITIPNSVTSIGYYAFAFCSRLKEVSCLARQVPSTDSNAFNNTNIASATLYVLESAIDNYKSAAPWSKFGTFKARDDFDFVADGIYYNINSDGTSVSVTYKNTDYNSYSGSVVIPSTVTYNNKQYSVTSIGNNAFYGCSGLTSISIPESVTSTGNYAFSGCSALTSVTINSNAIVSKTYTSSSNLGTIFGSQVTEYIIGDAITSIGSYAFYGCSGLTPITIPSSVTSIGDNAFYGCSGITSITIPSSVTSIGEEAFRSCSGLTSVTINSNAIVSKTYTSSSNLKTIFGSQVKEYIIGDAITSIGSYAFYDCSGLTKAEFASIESLCKIAFGNGSANPLYYAKHLYINGQEVTDLVIPNTVTSIGYLAFISCSSLTSVTIPNSVTSIGKEAFDFCSGLTSVNIPSSVTSIGNYAFNGCSGLTSIVVDKDNTYYDSRDNCNAIIQTSSNTMISGCKSTVIPNSVTSIGVGAFSRCSGLTSVIIPESVKSIGAYAFQYCTGLKEVSCMAETVPTTSSNAFNNTSIASAILCVPASAINDYKSTAPWSSFGTFVELNYDFMADGLYYSINTDGTSVTVTYKTTSYNSYSGSLVIPATITYSGKQYNVTSIDNSVFRNCSDLTSVTIPESVTSIGDRAFYGCSGLTSITVPSSVTNIGSSAFYGCSGLTSVTIPSSVTSIGEEAFRSCSGLTSIVVDKDNTYYDSRDNCNAIIQTSSNTLISGCKSTVIPNSVTSIGGYAFYNCSGLTSITIPESVTSIGNYAFAYCSSLKEVYCMAKQVPSTASNAFNNTNIASARLYVPASAVDAYKSTTPWRGFGTIALERVYDFEANGICYYVNSNATSVTITYRTTDYNSYSGSVVIPSTVNYSGKQYSVTGIGKTTFYNCSGLKSVTIPSSVTSIGDDAFYGCSGITSITIPSSVTIIGEEVFRSCSGLKSITIPNSVTSIGDSVFYDCSGLTSITIPTSVKSIGYSALKNCASLKSITIPTSVTSIGDDAFSGCSGLTSVTINSNAIVSNTYTSSSNLETIFGSQVKEYIIGDAITSIGAYVFYNCCNLTSITIPNNVKSIGNYAFYNCYRLTSITIPNSVTSIGSYAFRKCSGLTSVTIPNSVTSIGKEAFEDCSGLKSITIPNSVASIGEKAFRYCSGLTSITIPESVTSIGDYAFYWCSGLESVTINSNKLVSKTYTSSSNLGKVFNVSADIILGNTVTSIGDYAFYSGSSLASVTIPNSVTSIGDEAFPSSCKIYIDKSAYALETLWDNGISPYDKTTKALLAIPSASMTNSASSIRLTGTTYSGGMEMTSQSYTVSGTTKTGNSASFTGLTPGTSYPVAYKATVRYGGNTLTYTRNYSMSTSELTLTTSQPKVISAGNVIVEATSNLDDEEENAGFEWRRTDWTADFSSNTGAAYLYEGTMEGYIRNLYTEKLWKVRPYYRDNNGTYYYGEWVGLDPTNTSYFEPTVHTYAKISVTGNKALLSGYVQRGSDNVSKQGFKYWADASGARGAGITIPTSAKTIEAEGRIMEAELTGLLPNTTYSYVAFVTTTEGETFYGKQLSFTTGDDPEASVTGDANGNGVVEIGDVTSVLTLMATPEATGYDNKAADANQNGVIEIGDVTTILTIMANGE